RRWFCQTAPSKTAGDGCPVRCSIDDSDLVQEVSTWLTMHRDGHPDVTPDLVKRQIQAQQAESDVVVLEREIKRQENRKNILVNLAADEEVDASDLASGMREIKAEIARLSADLSAAKRQQAVNALPPADTFGALLEGWPTMDASMLNRGFATVVDSIFV